MKTWNDEQLRILREEYPTSDLDKLAVKLEKTRLAIRSKAKILGVKRSSDVRVWTSAKKEKLKAIYPNMTNEEIAKELGSTASAVDGMAFKLKLRKSKEFMFEHSSKGFYTKGHIPMNKGRKQTEYMSAEKIERTKATRFQKGHCPKNYKPVGYERITKDGYIEIKVADPNVFELKHRKLWIEHNGPIPKGYNIQFRDGNKKNISIDNLYMISRSEQMRTKNSMYARFPKELQHLIKLKGALNRQINKANKK